MLVQNAFNIIYGSLLPSSSIQNPTDPLYAIIWPIHYSGWYSFNLLSNDPSTGSPTETLLRLLLPLDTSVHPNSKITWPKPSYILSLGLTKESNR